MGKERVVKVPQYVETLQGQVLHNGELLDVEVSMEDLTVIIKIPKDCSAKNLMRIVKFEEDTCGV